MSFIVCPLVLSPVRVLVQQADQADARAGRSPAVGYDGTVLQFRAVECGVVIQVFAQGGPFQSNTYKQALGPRPRKNLRMHLGVGLSRRCPSDRPCCNRTLGTQGELTLKQLLRSAFRHDQHDQVRLRTTDLEADAAALDTTRGGRRPARAALVAAGQIPFSVLAADYESRRLEPRHNDDAVCLL